MCFRGMNLILLLAVGLVPDAAALFSHSTFLVHAEEPKLLRMAGITTLYRRHSHADVLLSRLLETDTLDGQGRKLPWKLVSVYADQVAADDLSQPYARKYGFRLSPTIQDALTLGTQELAVDGVFLIAEHGTYPMSPTGQIEYPKRRLFSEMVEVFQKSRRVVPVFHDKHFADTTQDALWYYETAKTQKIPLMAGSSIPSTWRDPPIDVPRGAVLSHVLVLSYGPLDAYGFHGLELLQALAERRRGGETGVKSVKTISGPAVWEALDTGTIPASLVQAALARFKKRPPLGLAVARNKVVQPVAFQVQYRDGTVGTVLTLPGVAAEWSAAWSVRGVAEIESFTVDLQDEHPYMHFGQLLHGLEPFFESGQPTWPVERTLTTTLLLDAALTSHSLDGKVVMTNALSDGYPSDWSWRQPTEHGRLRK